MNIKKREFIKKLHSHEVINEENEYYQIIPVQIGPCKMGETYLKR